MSELPILNTCKVPRFFVKKIGAPTNFFRQKLILPQNLGQIFFSALKIGAEKFGVSSSSEQVATLDSAKRIIWMSWVEGLRTLGTLGRRLGEGGRNDNKRQVMYCNVVCCSEVYSTVLYSTLLFCTILYPAHMNNKR